MQLHLRVLNYWHQLSQAAENRRVPNVRADHRGRGKSIGEKRPLK